jgi:hypothetical protein
MIARSEPFHTATLLPALSKIICAGLPAEVFLGRGMPGKGHKHTAVN